MIYFVQRESDGVIKVGTTKCWDRRRKSLSQTFGKGLKLLAVCDGSHREERKIHRILATHSLGGELFRPSAEVLDLIKLVGRPWDGKDEVTTIATIYGCDEFRDWLQEGAKYAGVDLRTLFRIAAEWYAKEIGFLEPAPEM